ncbi:hypothetical protein NL492_27165, partial [Klebsiella pneumoniae]|nr:hypothetical protein [Klebsiella pneumoniae]
GRTFPLGEQFDNAVAVHETSGFRVDEHRGIPGYVRISPLVFYVAVLYYFFPTKTTIPNYEHNRY